MKAHNVYQMVFSSSCCVYGDPEHLPITEDHPTGNVTNVYGRTKYLIEEMLKDLTNAEPVRDGAVTGALGWAVNFHRELWLET